MVEPPKMSLIRCSTNILFNKHTPNENFYCIGPGFWCKLDHWTKSRLCSLTSRSRIKDLISEKRLMDIIRDKSQGLRIFQSINILSTGIWPTQHKIIIWVDCRQIVFGQMMCRRKFLSTECLSIKCFSAKRHGASQIRWDKKNWN
jgi:hypothetical protein